MGGDVLKTQSLSILLILILSGFVYAQSRTQKSDKTTSNNTPGNDSASQRILVDEEFDDWDNYPNLAEDGTTNNGPSVLKAANDQDILFFYFETDSILSLQNNNALTLFIDTDDNLETGKKVNGLGAEIEFRFGQREGTLYFNNQEDTIGVGPLFLIISPTVWSDKFEISLDLNSTINGKELFNNPAIRLLVKDSLSGYSIPEKDGGALYTFSKKPFTPLHSYSMDKPFDDLIRVLSHNVEFSSFFREDRKEAYRRMYQAIKPDIIGFSELYQDYKLQDVTNRLEEILPSPKGKSWKAKRTADNVLATRFLIKNNTAAGSFGNGAFLLDLRPKYNNDLLVIVAHPTCCDNDSSRQHEVDAMIKLIRDSKSSGTPFHLEDKTPVMIIGDMNFVGDPQQVKTLLEGDIFHEDIYGIDFKPDWDGSFFDDAKPLTADLPHTFTHTGYGSPGTYSNGRLDYIIYSGSVLDLKNSFVMFTPSMPQDLLAKHKIQKDDSQIASDHLPVIGDFKLLFEQEETSLFTLRQNDERGVPVNLNSIQTVTGIVTASREFGDTGIAFVQNEQAAVAIEGGNVIAKLESGDYVTITGKLSQHSGLTLLAKEPGHSQVVIHKKVKIPGPRVVSVADVQGQEWNGRELLEGQLLKIEKIKFLSSGKFEGGSKYKITDENDTLEIFINSNTDLVNNPIPPEQASITGCLVQNKSAAPFNNEYQLFPRSVNDLEIIKKIEQVPIIALRHNDNQGIPIYNDSTKAVSGIVTATNQFGRNGPAIIQDDEAGIALYGSAYINKLNLGDSVTVTGPVMVHRGMTEYYYDAEICEVVIHKNGAIPSPLPVSIADINNQEWNGVERLESKLVMINDVKITETGSFTSYRNYQISDGTNTISLRINRAGSLDGTKIPTGNISVIGIISQYKSSLPYQGGYQLLTRFPEDIIIK
jgi:hypothetical protein